MITTIFQFFGKLFIPYPALSLMPALILVLFYFKSKSKFILTTAIAWLLYMAYEELHLLRIVCSGECNIRIDLLLIYPILIILSVIALFIGIKDMTKSSHQ
ncbi:MAG: hypothetical protein RLZZ67_340 [Candidatus Parcubacteria bacterium]|jgi:hypothetical protein